MKLMLPAPITSKTTIGIKIFIILVMNSNYLLHNCTCFHKFSIFVLIFLLYSISVHLVKYMYTDILYVKPLIGHHTVIAHIDSNVTISGVAHLYM